MGGIVLGGGLVSEGYKGRRRKEEEESLLGRDDGSYVR